MMVPTLTTEQRRENLAKAMVIRQRRAELKDQLKNGLIGIEKIFSLADDGHDEASGMRVSQLISAMPGYGFAKTRDAMHELHIYHGKRVKGLGVRQRRALVELLGGDVA